MRPFELKLSEWHRLYQEVGTVERALADALLRGSHEESERLRQRAAILHKESEAAMEALQAAIASRRSARERH